MLQPLCCDNPDLFYACTRSVEEWGEEFCDEQWTCCNCEAVLTVADIQHIREDQENVDI